MFDNQNPFKQEKKPKELLVEESVYHATGNGIIDEQLNKKFNQKQADIEPDKSTQEPHVDIYDNEELEEKTKREIMEEKMYPKDELGFGISNQEHNREKSSKRNPKGDNMKTMPPEKREREARGSLREMLHSTESEKMSLLSRFGTVVPSEIEKQINEGILRGEFTEIPENFDDYTEDDIPEQAAFEQKYTEKQKQEIIDQAATKEWMDSDDVTRRRENDWRENRKEAA